MDYMDILAFTASLYNGLESDGFFAADAEKLINKLVTVPKNKDKVKFPDISKELLIQPILKYFQVESKQKQEILQAIPELVKEFPNLTLTGPLSSDDKNAARPSIVRENSILEEEKGDNRLQRTNS
jgi:hypothetical protein